VLCSSDNPGDDKNRHLLRNALLEYVAIYFIVISRQNCFFRKHGNVLKCVLS